MALAGARGRSGRASAAGRRRANLCARRIFTFRRSPNLSAAPPPAVECLISAITRPHARPFRSIFVVQSNDSAGGASCRAPREGGPRPESIKSIVDDEVYRSALSRGSLGRGVRVGPIGR